MKVTLHVVHDVEVDSNHSDCCQQYQDPNDAQSCKYLYIYHGFNGNAAKCQLFDKRLDPVKLGRRDLDFKRTAECKQSTTGFGSEHAKD